LAKISIILYLAKFFSNYPNNTKNFLYNIFAFFIVLIPGFLVINQPDLGTGSMLILLGFSLIFLNGLSWNIIFSLAIASLISIPILWQNLLEYQKYRILVFLNPELDILGKGYQIMQSKIAIGSGGMLGKGFLTGSQSRLDFLPEKHTDFVFTLISEEMGFVGSLSVLMLYFFINVILIREFLKEDNFTNKILIFGVSFLIFLYVVFNIGMVSGLIPVVGAPLPFISNGGTSLITIFIGLGIVQSIRVSRNV
ncbi:FtsW/RodA/SpoVE family cell cycle protein, partial [Alphaproteobacteria bacterium]|nr:FtsW/RodA/SpoVE family cell cycle protein [Alphaproteobacteria bacterium]